MQQSQDASNVMLAGRTVLVTGAARGIGRSIAEACALAGADVALNFRRRPESAEEIAAAIGQASGRKVIALQADISQPQQVERLVSDAVAVLGRVDILVNNAAITADGLFLALEPSDWRRVFRTNLDGAAHCIRAVLPEMLIRRRGSIVNVSSIAARRPNRGQCNYAAAKAALEGLTRSLARELGGKGVRINCVSPGIIETDMSADLREAADAGLRTAIPLARFGKPSEVANAVVFLASDDASYVTGQVVRVDGGLA